MLSKMAKYEIFRIKLTPNLASEWGEVTTEWKRTLTTGKEAIIRVTNTISCGDAYVDIDEEQYQELLLKSDQDVMLTHYDGGFENYGCGIGKVTVTCCNEYVLNEQEKNEVYRSIYKWDLVYREKSSDSESDSGSEMDQAKLKRHTWICTVEYHKLLGGFTIKK
jgi:hypothetical protein